MALQLPPLALYIHIPWCVQKCPYCDFNSHAIKQGIPEQEYIAHLLADLDQDLSLVSGRSLSTIFIGGGTPSVFSAAGIGQILQGVKQRLNCDTDMEVTLEANPGTLEAERFTGYVNAGVTRFSIGVQSFQTAQLKALGRIHDSNEAIAAAKLAKQLPLKSFNLDLMHGLPQQDLTGALADLQQAIDLAPPHLSWYQLTIEPNTAFASRPPILPPDDTLWDIQQQGLELLQQHGYQQYEISAYAKTGQQCQHNLNYWRYGDYLGIGCGAHGKITLPSRNAILRTVKIKHPKGYMDISRGYVDSREQVAAEDRPFEFFMNRFRLLEPCPISDFTAYTGLPLSTIAEPLKEAEQKELITITDSHWQITDKGARYLNDLLTIFI
ncbi:radical SAM family heme chaperone HemW [Rheinheimera sp. D18]|uniref:radical SAM family heme chaperone HemW n=1 Tax=Rheinheimera sp. D18 TaxID=2545632 RepID=UPI00104472B2|nr:radical SAM family heme chaperone HemW [Rheinheimera sp. D18]QBL08997.1 radical SAM family heme chaperone HemW [Rheinheimera sp. D18]